MSDSVIAAFLTGIRVRRRLAALIAALAALLGVVSVAGAVFSAPVTLSRRIRRREPPDRERR